MDVVGDQGNAPKLGECNKAAQFFEFHS
jgi:hypothetical protein